MPAKTITVEELFSRRLREIREERGVTQAELSDRMAAQGTPVDRLTILKIERAGRPDAKGKSRRVSIEEALAFASALGTSPLSLILPRESEVVEIGNRRLELDELRRWLTGAIEVEDEVADLGRKITQLEEQMAGTRAKLAEIKRNRLDKEREEPSGKHR